MQHPPPRKGRGDRPGGGRQAPGALEDLPEPAHAAPGELTEQPGPRISRSWPRHLAAAEWVDVRPLRRTAPGSHPANPRPATTTQRALPRPRSSATACRRQARSSSPAPLTGAHAAGAPA
jgi:hypothetical protein